MKKWILLIVVGGVILGAVACLLFIGPEMKDQPNIRAYQARFPLPPAGVVPVEPLGSSSPAEVAALRRAGAPPSPAPIPPEEPAKDAPLLNPLRATEQNLARGRVYYQYYCQMCHGATGDGNGPVGQSFVPPLPDLRAAKVQTLSDDELLRAMLTGIGHHPAGSLAGRPAVLEYIVLPEHRWYLVLYVRGLGAGEAAGRP